MKENQNIVRMYWLHALTPVHVGVGEGLGFIDLPIMREKVTGWPMILGSAVKGVISDHFGASDEKERGKNLPLKAAFGVSGEEHSNAGSLVFTDSRIVCLAVRSLYGTFAWVTCPMALNRLKRDLDAAELGTDLKNLMAVKLTANIPEGNDSALVSPSPGKKIYLEDLDFESKSCPDTKNWGEKLAGWIFPDNENEGWRKLFMARFVILDDNTFSFLCDTATEVNTRIRIDPERKIVLTGALWTEESLPAESILAGIVWCDKVFIDNFEPTSGKSKSETLMDIFLGRPLNLQIGGKATVGKGQVRCLFTGGK
jgi:CRISPR-associated protein Cmr4